MKKSISDNGSVDQEIAPSAPKRNRLFLPWGKPEAPVMLNLQEGFGALTDLMRAIREGLDRQVQRNEEMLTYLAYLPEVLQSLPETQRMQAEALKAIGRQIEQQVQQQGQLTEILAKVGQTSGDQKEVLKTLQVRMDTMQTHSQSISENLRQVGTMMEGVGRNSAASADLLRRVQETLRAREDKQEEAIRRQTSRMNTLLIVALSLSAAALAAAGVMAALVVRAMG